ncbi:MAG: hypothetical protein EOP02_32495, partial [Proteobacteria bacterium]
MPTTTVGLFFIRQGRASNPAVSTDRSDDGQFVLKMRLLDHQGPHKEGYVVRWIGEDARAFHAAHRGVDLGRLQAGQAARVAQVERQRVAGLEVRVRGVEG